MVEWQFQTAFSKFCTSFSSYRFIRIGSLNISKRQNDSWCYISDPSKWRALCIWEIASYISNIANIYALLDKLVVKMQQNAAASLLARHWIVLDNPATSEILLIPNRIINPYVFLCFPGIFSHVFTVSIFSATRIKSLRQIIIPHETRREKKLARNCKKVYR